MVLPALLVQPPSRVRPACGGCGGGQRNHHHGRPVAVQRAAGVRSCQISPVYRFAATGFNPKQLGFEFNKTLE
jgi:hypothetical protein